MKIRVIHAWTIIAILVGVSNPVFATDVEFEKGFEVVKRGYESGNQQLMDSGIKMLEKAANGGSGMSAFNLGALYHAPQFADEAKSCYWTTKAANMNYVEAYYGAASCAMNANRGGDKFTTMDKYAMPWIVKVSKEGSPEDQANARQTIDEWEQAKKELANNQRSGGTVRLGDLFSAFGIDTISASNKSSASANRVSESRTFVCKVYCKSASGPVTLQEVTANSRSEAAKWVGDNANTICRNDGNGFASSQHFSESQCSKK